MSTLAATRRRLRDIVDQAQQIDVMLTDAERCEALGDPALTALQTARLLVVVDRLASRLEAVGDRLGELGPFEPVDDSVETLEV